MATLESLLAEEAAILGDFLAAIAAERKCISGGDIHSLPATTEQKSALASRLAGLASQRDAALAALGLDAGRQGIETWLSRLPATSLAPRQAWQAILDRAASARRENELNGKLIAGRLQQNQQALGTLLGDAADAGTYGADGQRNPGSGRRTLGSA